MLAGMQVSELRIGDKFHDIDPGEYAKLSDTKKRKLATFTVAKLEEPKSCVGCRHVAVTLPESRKTHGWWCTPLEAEVTVAA